MSQDYGNSPQDALTAADSEAYVICPSRAIAALAAKAGVPTHAFEFAHFKSHNCDAGIPCVRVLCCVCSCHVTA